MGVSEAKQLAGSRPRAHQRKVSPELADGFGADYADCFVIETPCGIAARSWAAASLRGADGAFSRLVWHGLLGFDVAPIGAEGTLVGWGIRRETPTRFDVETDGRLMAGRMVFVVEGERLAWATMLRFHRDAGRRIWAVAGHAHRALAPRCLESAARRLRPTS